MPQVREVPHTYLRTRHKGTKFVLPQERPLSAAKNRPASSRVAGSGKLKTAPPTEDADLQLLKTLTVVKSHLSLISDRLDAVESWRRWNQLACALEKSFEKVASSRSLNHVHVPVDSSVNDKARDQPVYVNVVGTGHEHHRQRVFVLPLTTADRGVPHTSFRCLGSLVVSLVKLLPMKFSDVRAKLNATLPELERKFDAFHWAPVPEFKNGELLWMIHVIPEAEDHKVVCQLDAAVSRESCAPSASAFQATLGEYDEATIKFDGFDSQDPHGSFFRSLILMTVYVHWRREDLSFALHKIRKTLKHLQSPSQRTMAWVFDRQQNPSEMDTTEQPF